MEENGYNITRSPSTVECAWCKKMWDPAEPRFKMCGACKLMAYCSKSCQVRHWREGPAPHRTQCNKATPLRIPESIKNAARHEPEKPCECYDDWNWHHYLGLQLGVCARLGCSNQVTITRFGMSFDQCTVHRGKVHAMALLLCSVSCQAAYDIHKSRGKFWTASHVRATPEQTFAVAKRDFPGLFSAVTNTTRALETHLASNTLEVNHVKIFLAQALDSAIKKLSPKEREGVGLNTEALALELGMSTDLITWCNNQVSVNPKQLWEWQVAKRIVRLDIINSS